MKKKLQSLGFTSGHAHLLLVTVAIFSVLFVSKAGINLKTMFVKADDQPVKTLTFEELKNQATAKYSSSSIAQSSAEDEKQLALLDRSLEDGKVLGDSIGIGNIPNAETLFTPENLDKIPVKNVINNPTGQDAKVYSNKISYIESSNDVITLLANINSGDTATIKSSQEQATKIIQLLGVISVPSDFLEYHRFKIIYYTTLINIADVWMKNRPEGDLQTQSTMMFSVMTKIESLRDRLQDKYHITL